MNWTETAKTSIGWMIVNLHNVSNLREWKNNKQNVYIGRRKGVFEESKWANPHRITQTTSRDQAVLLFEQDFRGNSTLLKDITQLRGNTLGCWCKPKQCHFIEKILEEITSGK